TYFYDSRVNNEIFKKKFVHYIDEVDKSMIDHNYELNVRHEIYQNLEVVKLDLDFKFEEVHNYLPELFLPEIDFEKYDLLVFDKELLFRDKDGINWLKTFVETLFKEIEKIVNKTLKKAFVSKRKDIFEFSINPSIIELMGVIRDSGCIICFDSGIVHIASAFDKNMVVIFSNRYFEFDIRRWAPLSTNNKILKLNIFNEEGILDFDLTNPIEYAQYVAYNAKNYI
ncbi:MAG: glycosyltransferase family 9 protein, partial [bacterium]